MKEPIEKLNKEELDAVVFAVRSDLETLANAIGESEASPEWKREYAVLDSAYNKLEKMI